MRLHILGICGTFMGGLARLAVEKGFEVTGSDQNCYPPMSTQLQQLGISLHQGYDAEQLSDSPDSPDCVVVGNAMSRGIDVVEALLNSNQAFKSGPQWLGENILQDKWVIGVAGTHGKTSSASMIAWILEYAGFNPGFLIGGVVENFGVSARLTDSPFFVVEADEYDTAFFDKRSKFLHYRIRTCLMNNLEFDHADIFDDLAAIEKQFHHLVRTIPSNGLIIKPEADSALSRVLAKGCWSEVQSLVVNKEPGDANWCARKLAENGSEFEVYLRGELQGIVRWSLIGDHNVSNALGAIAAAHHVGVTCIDAVKGLSEFKSVKRRMELKGEVNGIKVFDDFAHHPTAIKTTLNGLRASVDRQRIIAVVDVRSNTMKMGTHGDALIKSVGAAEHTFFHVPSEVGSKVQLELEDNMLVCQTPQVIIDKLVEMTMPGDNILIMSNGGFGGIHDKLLAALETRWRSQ